MENSPLAPRNRRRREREPPRRSNAEEQEKPSSRAQEKLMSRTPLRFVPDAAGFETLTKPEIKSDIREIEKNTTMLPPYEPENEAMDGLIICSSKPPCPPESNIAKKRKRYITWINNPELVEQDMDKYRAALHQIHEEYKEVLEDELRWSDAFFVVRRHLLAQINLLDEEMKELRSQGKQLYSMCVEESGIHSRKRRTMHMRDVLTELHDRNEELMAQVAEHKKLLADAESISGLEHLTKPLRCELGVESLGYRPHDSVSTPYGKGVVVAIDDRRNRQAGVVVVVKLDFGTAYLQHGQVQTLQKWATKVERAVSDDQSAMDVAGQRLMSRFSAVEERLRLAEANVGDIENFLPDDEDEEDAGGSSDGLDDEPLAARRAAEHAQAALFIQRGPNYDDAFWLQQFEARTSKQQSRRKRRAASAIECHTTLLPRTPYQVPLLLSPVSQFPDRYLGGLYGADPKQEWTANHMQVPGQLVRAENIILDNQHLMANLARAKILVKRLQDAKDDWEKQLDESQKTLVRTRGVYQSLEAESEMLFAQHRRDLAAWQIGSGATMQVGEADLLLAAQADAQQRSARGIARGGNRRTSRGGARSRGSLKGDAFSLSQESVASNGADVDLEQDKPFGHSASADSEALAIGALTSLGGAGAEEDMEDDDKKGSKKRVVRRRNR